MGDVVKPACYLSDASVFCEAKGGFFFLCLYFYCASNSQDIVFSFFDRGDGSLFADFAGFAAALSCLPGWNDSIVLYFSSY